METDNSLPKPQVSYYGKKVYYLNAVAVKKVMPAKKEPEYFYENIEEDKDR